MVQGGWWRTRAGLPMHLLRHVQDVLVEQVAECCYSLVRD